MRYTEPMAGILNLTQNAEIVVPDEAGLRELIDAVRQSRPFAVISARALLRGGRLPARVRGPFGATCTTLCEVVEVVGAHARLRMLEPSTSELVRQLEPAAERGGRIEGPPLGHITADGQLCFESSSFWWAARASIAQFQGVVMTAPPELELPERLDAFITVGETRGRAVVGVSLHRRADAFVDVRFAPTPEVERALDALSRSLIVVDDQPQSPVDISIDNGDPIEQLLDLEYDLPETPRYRLLVVEDDAENRRMLGAYLRKQDFAVTEAEDGLQALALIAENAYDLVLLDVMMPGLSGLEVLERIRFGHERSTLPVVMVTAVHDNAEVIRAQTLGANDYITKPYELGVLLSRVKARLDSSAVREVPSEKQAGSDTVVLDPDVPLLDGERLCFSSKSDFLAVKRDLVLLRAVMATSQAALVAIETRALRFVIGTYEHDTSMRCTISPGGPGRVIVQFDAIEALEQALQRLDIALSKMTDAALTGDAAAAPDGQPVALTLPPVGRLSHPSTVSDLLALRPSRKLTSTQLAAPASVLLLRWLHEHRGVVRVDVACSKRAAVSFYVIHGNEVRSATAVGPLARSLTGAEGSYRVQESRRVPPMNHRTSVMALTQHVLRLSLAGLDDADLARGLSRTDTKAPQLNAVGGRLLPKLDLPGSLARFADKRVRGLETTAELVGPTLGVRTTWELLYILELVGALDWVDPAKAAAAEATRAEREEQDEGAQEIMALWAKVEGANHFEVLGLHWSTTPRMIGEQYLDLRERYGPQGTRRRFAPEVCDQFWTRVEHAYMVLRDATSRRAYRDAHYTAARDAQLTLMLDRAEIALLRFDFAEALDLLMACQDIQETERGNLLVDRLRKLQQG